MQLPKLHTGVRFPSPAPSLVCWEADFRDQPFSQSGTVKEAKGIYRRGRIFWYKWQENERTQIRQS